MFENKKTTMVGLLCVLVLVVCSCSHGNKIPQNDITTDNFSDENEMINEFVSWCPYSDDYLVELCDTYELEKMTEKCQSDYEKVQVISN